MLKQSSNECSIVKLVIASPIQQVKLVMHLHDRKSNFSKLVKKYISKLVKKSNISKSASENSLDYRPTKTGYSFQMANIYTYSVVLFCSLIHLKATKRRATFLFKSDKEAVLPFLFENKTGSYMNK